MERGGNPFDDRAEAYRKSGDMVAAIAQVHHHLEIDETTQERWRQLMGLMREIDTWADDTGATTDDVLVGLIDFGMFRERYPDLAPGKMDLLSQLTMLNRTAHILNVGKLAARELSPRRYMAFRLIEARETVNMFSDTATPEVTNQPGFKEEFLPTMKALGEAATLWDSIVDGKQDLRQGKQALRPNAEYYARLTGGIFKRMKLGGAALLHFAPYKYAGVKVGMRIMNRLRHGVPEYSNLNRLRPGRRRLNK